MRHPVKVARPSTTAPVSAPPRAAPTPAPTTFPAAAPAPRLQALDVARGLMLVVSVAVNAWITAPAWFEHAPWDAVHPVDLVFPTFVALSGAGLAMAYARGIRPRREARRVVVLVAFGFAYTALTQYVTTGGIDLASLRIPGVLQLYAVVVLGIALISRVATVWWQWLVAALALAVGQTGVYAVWAGTCAGGVLTRDCNPSGVVDTALFGASHVYMSGTYGHDPEGVFAALGALITAAVGASAGRIALDHRDGGSRMSLLRATAVTVGCCVAAAVVAGRFVAPFKRLWTAPFAVETAVVAAVVLLALHLLLDDRRVGAFEQVARYPLVALGRNSLLVYFGSHALVTVLQRTGPAGGVPVRGDSWAQVWQVQAEDLAGSPGAAWPFCLAAVLAWTACAMLLHARRIYLKA